MSPQLSARLSALHPGDEQQLPAFQIRGGGAGAEGAEEGVGEGSEGRRWREVEGLTAAAGAGEGDEEETSC